MSKLLAAVIGCACFCMPPMLRAQVPQLINYQGRVVSGSTNFNGTGQFKFALVNTNGSTTYWSNDGTSSGGSQPTNAVSLTVTNGLYSVLLGDSSITNMTAIPGTVFNNSDVRLRVWFNDGTNGFQQLAPDQRIAAVGYAILASNVPDGTITGTKIASGTITSANIANGAIQNAQLGNNAVMANNIASGAVGATQIASGAVGNGQLANGSVTSSKISGPVSLSGSVPGGSSIITGNSTSGSGNGVEGDSLNFYGLLGNSTNYIGVSGSGGTYGVSGTGNSIGVYGNGPTGLYGITTATSSSGNVKAGVLGVASANDPNIAGLWGTNSATGGTAIVGKATGSTSGTGIFGSGATYGVYASGGTGVFASSSSGAGIFGTTTAVGSNIAGVWGENTGSGGTGLVGHATNSSGGTGIYGLGTTYGVFGDGGNTGIGVFGTTNIAGSTIAAVWGENSANGGTAVVAKATDPNSSTGVFASGVVGVHAESTLATSPALQIGQGAIRVVGAGVGTSTAAFTHRADSSNTPGHTTYINNPLLNGDPTAIVIMTPAGPVASYFNNHPTGVGYDPGPKQWFIENLDDNDFDVSNGRYYLFNILVIKP